ncbi:MAG: Sua5/YciO/YrdC/YwlC family protein, partial [Parcubacteria group bacterium]|nr:Sua5/YciO/YrdC/YwlC family protein [Parcubacteria group bacterium]
MKILDIRNNFSPELASKEAALALLKGRTVVYPTDTLYGLGANIFDTEAIRKIFAVKKRSDKKPLPVMVSSIGMAKAVAVIDSQR